ncbi:MAG: beta-lactamase family protein [Bacteroidetes bacterium]|nr:beta-lactamase family protein [Bacteroidota bacterium]
MVKVVCVICVFLYSDAVFSQSKQDKIFVRAIDELLSKQFPSNAPGCAILVSKKGKIIYRKSFGLADLELKVLARPEMIFRLGSITKQFTSVAILQLVEQGKISLKDSIQKFIKDFPSKKKTITIENLLSHTSGIVDYTQLDIPDPFIRRKDFNPKEIVDLFKNELLEFQPDTKFKYSNSNYFLLGYILEIVEGKKYQEIIEERISKPLGLTNTRYDDNSKVITNRVNGYKLENGNYTNCDFQSPSIAFAAGALLSNIDDLLKWHQGLYSLKILKKETLNDALTPYKLNDGTNSNYGFGWFVIDMNGSRSIQHGGNINGFRSNEIYFPDEDVFVATLFNCECTPMEEISEQVALQAIGKTPNENIELPEAILDSYLGKYVMQEDPKRPLFVTKVGKKLIAGIANEWKAELSALSETKFNVKNIRPAGTITFVKETDGTISKVIVNQSGKDYVAFRVKD